MADHDKPAPDAQAGTPVSPHRRRTAQARAERDARLAASLRSNIARRKQQARDRSAGAAPAEPDDDPAA